MEDRIKNILEYDLPNNINKNNYLMEIINLMQEFLKNKEYSLLYETFWYFQKMNNMINTKKLEEIYYELNDLLLDVQEDIV